MSTQNSSVPKIDGDGQRQWPLAGLQRLQLRADGVVLGAGAGVVRAAPRGLRDGLFAALTLALTQRMPR